MIRLILGLVKGSAIGAVVGYGAFSIGMGARWNWLVCGLAGGLVGVLVGRPIWSHLRDQKSTVWTPVLKAVVGFGVSVGLYFAVTALWSGFEIHSSAISGNVLEIPFAIGAGIGGLYGAFVEVDDSDAKRDPAGKSRPS